MASDTAGAEAEPDAETLARRLRAAREEQRAAEDAVADIGETTLRSLRDAHRGLRGLLDQYDDTATGSGDFEAYMECRMNVQEHVENLDADLPERDRFEAVAERFDARRLSERDFDWARNELEPVADLVERLNRRQEASEKRSDARRAVMQRLERIEERIDTLREIERLGSADLDAPVEELRDPIERYNDAVTSDFETIRREWPARELLSLIQTTTAYPLVEFREPPTDLIEYVERQEAGTEPVETLLEYADFSRSKLDHYLDAPMALKRHVATHRTYLSRLDATPLHVTWPPPAAETLQFRARELVAITERFAAEETVAALHEVRRATKRSDYETLRDAARARVELDPEERDRLRSGEIATEREQLEEERETLRTVLEGD
jgi:hypothetical protein